MWILDKIFSTRDCYCTRKYLDIGMDSVVFSMAIFYTNDRNVIHVVCRLFGGIYYRQIFNFIRN